MYQVPGYLLEPELPLVFRCLNMSLQMMIMIAWLGMEAFECIISVDLYRPIVFTAPGFERDYKYISDREVKYSSCTTP